MTAVTATTALTTLSNGRNASRPRVATVLLPAAVVLLALAAWWFATLQPGATALASPGEMGDQAATDGAGFYADHAWATFGRAAQGFLWGNGVALVSAACVLLLPEVEGYVVHIAVIAQCLPLIAIGPIVMIIFGGQAAAIFLSALIVSYPTLIAVIAGAQSASRTSLDLVKAYGGGRWAQLVRVRAMSALPSALSAIKIAVPGAVLGAIIGEYLGGISTGLGIAMSSAQYQMGVARLWNLALVTVLLTSAAYALAVLLEKTVTPWASAAQGKGTA